MKLHVAGMGYVPVPEKLQRKLLRAAVRTPRVASWLYTVQSGLGLSRAQIEELLERAAELPVGALRTVLARAGALGIDLLRRMLDDRKRLHVISQLPPSVYLRVHGLAFDTLEKVLHRYGRPRRWVVEQSPDRARSMAARYGIRAVRTVVVMVYADRYVLLTDPGEVYVTSAEVR